MKEYVIVKLLNGASKLLRYRVQSPKFIYGVLFLTLNFDF